MNVYEDIKTGLEQAIDYEKENNFKEVKIMGEYNPFEIDEFTWDVLKAYIKHGFGDYKLYATTFFSYSLTDDTACKTLYEFYNEAVDYDGVLWCSK